MKSGRILSNRLFTLSSVAFAFFSISANATETNIPDFYSESGASAKRNYAGTDTEVIDPLSGSLQLMDRRWPVVAGPDW
ncbi:MAG: hypothetical protein IPM37_20280 [Hahellaceae bacterium]|nr:hypothetical protein [Hahellaceae bacterium]